ncbi:MAG: GHKL domain-containing protein, partial [Gammaproteobacteria bacterium]|nr:GHKL domain-containing protein [Gammaproteobacteria bacterium]
LLKDLEGIVKQEAKRGQVEILGIDEILQQDDIVILGDQGKLQQALVNILLNAIQASSGHLAREKSGSKIEISLKHCTDSMTLSIRDQGSGIDDTIKDQIFDPFFTTKPIGKGTGLGLSISLGIVQNHKGHLSIQNADDGGAVVHIVLPILNS